MADLDSLINATIEVLQPLIKKPKLTPKLLGKPPFRFLHDLITGVADSTGFGQGLYTEDELNAASIKDKDSKLAYLEKIHLYVQAAHGSEIYLKLGKVVAGMEPEKTNEFLQTLASCANNPSINRDAALAAVLGGGDDGADLAAAEAERAAAEAQAQAEAEAQARAQAEAAQQAAQRAEAEAMARAQADQLEAENMDSQAAAQDGDAEQAQQAQEQAEMEQRRRQEEAARQQEEEAARQHEEEMMRRQQEEAAAAAAAQAPPGNDGPPGGPGYDEGDMDAGMGMAPPPQMERRALPARPTTARRPPPKLPSKEVKIDRGAKPVQPGAPVPAPTVVGLIGEGDDDEEEEEEQIQDAPLPGWDLGEKDGEEVVEGEQHGALVADIMNEKKKLKKDGMEEATEGEKPQEGGIIIIKKDKRRASLSSQQGKRPAAGKSEGDITQLRKSIQQLCQSTTPLGKCIEGVQADLEHMEREFRMWKSEGAVNSRKLEQTSSNVHDTVFLPLQQQVQEEEQKIKDMTLQINRVKANIMQNNVTIHTLLRGVVAGHRN